MDRKEIIKKFLFEGSSEKQKGRFEIAWDIWKELPSICESIKGDFFNKHLRRGLEEIFGDRFFIVFVVFNKVELFNIALSKNKWKIGDEPVYALKLNRNFGGNYELGLERWRSKLPQGVIEMEEKIRKFTEEKKTFNRTTQGWRFRDCFSDGLDDKKFILELVFHPEERAKFFLNRFRQLAHFLQESIDEGVTLENYIDDIVCHIEKE